MGKAAADRRSRPRGMGVGRLGIVRRLLVCIALFRAGAAFAQTSPVLTIPSTSTTPPVVLLNGFQLQCPGSSSSTFGDLERLLVPRCTSSITANVLIAPSRNWPRISAEY